RAAPALAALGWTPREADDELTRQLRGDLIRALGTLGNDRDVQARAAELYAAHERGTTVDPNVLPALIAVLAHTGDPARSAALPPASWRPTCTASSRSGASSSAARRSSSTSSSSGWR